MPGEPPHECDETCVCPVHGTPLIYHPAGDDHACQDIECEHHHGGLNPVLAAFDRIGMGWLKQFAVGQGFEDAAAVAQLAQDADPRAIEIRKRDPEEDARLIRDGYAEAGIPPEIAEAMIEAALEP